MIAFAWTAFRAMGGGARILLLLGLLASASAAAGVAYHKIWKRGYDRAILDVAHADRAAVQRALRAREALQACRSLERTWDQATGRCT